MDFWKADPPSKSAYTASNTYFSFPIRLFILPFFFFGFQRTLTNSTVLSSRATSPNGQAYTTTVAFTTTLPPGTVVTAPPLVTPNNGSNRSNTGAIVGGVVGGLCSSFRFSFPTRTHSFLISRYRRDNCFSFPYLSLLAKTKKRRVRWEL